MQKLEDYKKEYERSGKRKVCHTITKLRKQKKSSTVG